MMLGNIGTCALNLTWTPLGVNPCSYGSLNTGPIASSETLYLCIQQVTVILTLLTRVHYAIRDIPTKNPDFIFFPSYIDQVQPINLTVLSVLSQVHWCEISLSQFTPVVTFVTCIQNLPILNLTRALASQRSRLDLDTCIFTVVQQFCEDQTGPLHRIKFVVLEYYILVKNRRNAIPAIQY